MGFVKYTGALMFISLFAIAVITYAGLFQSDNNAQVSLDSDFANVSDSSRNSVQEFYSDTESASTAYHETTVQTQTDSSEGGTQFKVTAFSSLSQVRHSISLVFSKVFGFDSAFSIIATALVSILAFTWILYAWAAWKGNVN